MIKKIITLYECEVCGFADENASEIEFHEKSLSKIVQPELPNHLKNLKSGDKIFCFTKEGIIPNTFEGFKFCNLSHERFVNLRHSVFVPELNEDKPYSFEVPIEYIDPISGLRFLNKCNSTGIKLLASFWKRACLDFGLIPDPTIYEWFDGRICLIDEFLNALK